VSLLFTPGRDKCFVFLFFFFFRKPPFPLVARLTVVPFFPQRVSFPTSCEVLEWESIGFSSRCRPVLTVSLLGWLGLLATSSRSPKVLMPALPAPPVFRMEMLKWIDYLFLLTTLYSFVMRYGPCRSRCTPTNSRYRLYAGDCHASTLENYRNAAGAEIFFSFPLLPLWSSQ